MQPFQKDYLKGKSSVERNPKAFYRIGLFGIFPAYCRIQALRACWLLAIKGRVDSIAQLAFPADALTVDGLQQSWTFEPRYFNCSADKDPAPCVSLLQFLVHRNFITGLRNLSRQLTPRLTVADRKPKTYDQRVHGTLYL
jgi:hypothetical protein